jgi:guanylate kinase
MSKGKSIIITAPSGAGKTTIVRHLIGSGYLGLEFAISACTRPRREGEVHGRDYYFMTVDAFKDKIEEDAFVEWEEVYKNSYYGTLKKEVERIWTGNRNVLFDVDVKGALSLKKLLGSDALSLFIMPPSLEILKKRLESRGSDNTDAIESRINKAAHEIKYAQRFDRIIINDKLKDALAEAESLVSEFLGRQDI